MTTNHCTDPMLNSVLLLETATARAAGPLGLADDIVAEDPTDTIFDKTQRHCQLLRIFRGLDICFDGDLLAEQRWLNSYHQVLESKPKDLIAKREGLQQVVHHVERLALEQ